ncbi:MAG: dTMP kinase [Deltaproteobacteria bacterium]|nr:dTMP kinase [Deltaproteobacteria bacterium]
MAIFITFEGVEGCGKSTQAELLKGHLEAVGRKVVAVREPGATPVGEKIRSILVGSEGEGMSPLTELFLYEVCRAELVHKVIKPALEAGVDVICDRFTDSTLAYQGWGRGLDVGVIKRLNSIATSGLVPFVTFFLDCPPEVGLGRAFKRMRQGTPEDRFEKEALSFHSSVRKGFMELAAQEPDRVRIIDANRDISLIHGEICDIIKRCVSRKS